MRSIPHETPHLFFFALSMLDRSLQFRQHDIQRASELADLRVLGPFWNTLIQMTCSDFRGGLFYHAQRAQCASYKPESGDGDEHQHHTAIINCTRARPRSKFCSESKFFATTVMTPSRSVAMARHSEAELDSRVESTVSGAAPITSSSTCGMDSYGLR